MVAIRRLRVPRNRAGGEQSCLGQPCLISYSTELSGKRKLSCPCHIWVQGSCIQGVLDLAGLKHERVVHCRKSVGCEEERGCERVQDEALGAAACGSVQCWSSL